MIYYELRGRFPSSVFAEDGFCWYHSSILFWPNRILLRGLSGCCFRGKSLLWSLQRACASSHPVVGVINHTLCLRGNHWDPSWICTSSWYDWLPKVLKIWQQKRTTGVHFHLVESTFRLGLEPFFEKSETRRGCVIFPVPSWQPSMALSKCPASLLLSFSSSARFWESLLNIFHSFLSRYIWLKGDGVLLKARNLQVLSTQIILFFPRNNASWRLSLDQMCTLWIHAQSFIIRLCTDPTWLAHKYESGKRHLILNLPQAKNLGLSQQLLLLHHHRKIKFKYIAEFIFIFIL